MSDTPYTPKVLRYNDETSCKGREDSKLCPLCVHRKAKTDDNHFLNPPARNAKTCECFTHVMPITRRALPSDRQLESEV